MSYFARAMKLSSAYTSSSCPRHHRSSRHSSLFRNRHLRRQKT
ncbi:hypothetical protein IEO21_04902 [Rhodonia placenta]|uniref:Uncharacterized protein n=1 Tax=Rhodonia placenta TaxID=104341 RepID=A0A8H7U2U3_9APHY|nr:hypothetical protein IEO21_04902 [Postia placenta]